MIEILNGIHETVAYDTCRGLKLYINIHAEDYPLHWHTALEIVLPYQNEYTVIIDKIPHVLQEGDIFITPPGTLHELKSPSQGARLILLFDYSQICHVNGMDALLHALHPYALISRSQNAGLNRALRFYLDEVRREYEKKLPFMEACLYSLMVRFFVELGRSSLCAENRFPGIASGKQREYVEKFMDICNYITDHCTEPLTLDQLSHRAGFSRFHFSRLFKQFTGMSFYEYLLQKRMEQALQLLIRPDLTITEIAMASGFGSLSTFNRVFKAAKGCTPSEYKKLNRQEPNSRQSQPPAQH